MNLSCELSLDSVRDFIIYRGGRVKNHELVKQFKNALTNPENRGKRWTLSIFDTGVIRKEFKGFLAFKTFKLAINHHELWKSCQCIKLKRCVDVQHENTQRIMGYIELGQILLF